MPTKLVPITGSVLKWALGEANWDEADLANKIKVDRETVVAWVQGQAFPPTTEFRKLAKALARPTSLFFLSEPPDFSNVPVSLRHPPGVSQRGLTKQEADAVRQARRVQGITEWLRQRGAPSPSLPIPKQGISPTDAADVVRRELGWDTERQASAATARVVTNDLRQAIEDTGCIVMQLPLGRDGCRGFSLYSDSAPLIAANSAYNHEARTFSYLHELAHVLQRTEALCVGHVDLELERWCEEFAAEFLLPRHDLLEFVARYVGTSTLIEEPDQVTKIAAHFNVSRLATATALRKLGRATSTLWKTIRQQSELAARRGGGRSQEPQTSPVIRLREWGRTPTTLLLNAQEVGTLTRTDVQSYLRLSVPELDVMRSRLSHPELQD